MLNEFDIYANILKRIENNIYNYSLAVSPFSPEGGKIMKQYETMYIIKSTLDDAAKASLMEQMHGIITSHDGTIDKVDDMGLKEFAYKIDDMSKGYYVVVTYSVGVEGLNEFKRLMGINPDIVRSLTINTEEKEGK